MLTEFVIPTFFFLFLGAIGVCFGFVLPEITIIIVGAWLIEFGDTSNISNVVLAILTVVSCFAGFYAKYGNN